MYCEKCGTQNADDARFCSSCGKPFGGSAARASKTPEERQKMKNLGLIIAVVAVGLVLSITMISVIASILGGRGYKKTIEIYIDAQFDADAHDIFELVPDKMLDYLLKKDGKERDDLVLIIDDVNEDLERQIKQLNNYLGEGWEVTYEITSATKPEKEDYADLKEDYEDLGMKISDAKTVELDLIIKNESTENRNSVKIYLVKIGNSWYLDAKSMDLM